MTLELGGDGSGAAEEMMADMLEQFKQAFSGKLQSFLWNLAGAPSAEEEED